MLRHLSFRMAIAVLLLAGAGLAHADVFDLGTGDSFAIDQPRVTVQFGYPSASPTQFFPDGYGFTMILDTGASGYLLAAGAHQDLFGEPLPPYPIAGNYFEQGVGGFEPVQVTHPMQATISAFLGLEDILGSGGTPPGGVGTVIDPDARAVAAPLLNIGSFDGIIGMPAMANNAVVIDLAAMSSGEFGFDYIHAGFTGNVDGYLTPPPANAAVHTFNFSKFVVDASLGQDGGDGPLPSTQNLPVLGGVGLTSGGLTSNNGSFLFDTGAQITMISREKALALGIDPDAAQEFITVGGVGGEIEVPLVKLDTITLNTANGIDSLVLHDIAVGIIDIPGLPVDGILGFNAFTTGYLPLVLAGLGVEIGGVTSGAHGAFLEMVLDFIDETDDGIDDPWQMRLVRNTDYVPLTLEEEDLDPQALVVFPGGTGLNGLTLFAWPGVAVNEIPEPATGLLLAFVGVAVMPRRRGR